ncbi:hypothetical protein [Paenibacillus eucommiae]|uniref:Uncharacterized protein n=1 Tax=Paenibacillus eucommiae TaxID=1355755 RepID=A0ABS4J3K0_9BACL|nr:hypothetical protein [Paenibacillus eucommiae]MBP1994417.1 hypothetical protein [Paenibacillus eucommiae]
MKRKPIRIILLLVFLWLLSYFFMAESGYSFNENKALRNSLPYQDGKVVYQKDFGSNKIIIWDTANTKYAKVIHTKWGVLHQVRNVSVLLSREPGDAINRTWSASLNSKKLYETTFAVEVKNANIEKVIISNDNIDNEISEQLDEIKNNSSIFIELEVQDGFAVSYNELPVNDVGGFVFRGLDKNGQVITVGR